MKRKREKEKVIQLQVQLSKEISVVKTKVYRGSQRLLEKHKSTLKPQRERHVKMFKEIRRELTRYKTQPFNQRRRERVNRERNIFPSSEDLHQVSLMVN